MSIGRQREAWDRTSAVLAVLINVNRTDDRKAITPLELNPLRQNEQRQEKAENTELLHKYRRLAFLPVDERKRILALMEAEDHGKSD